MRGDFSRRPYDYVLRYLAAATGYNAVLEQQGRVPLDADWNEQRALDQYRLLTETRDIIGACGAPKADAGFAITPTSDGKSLQIGLGRYYVDGMLCECVAPSASATAIPLAQQPYLPHPPNQPQTSPYANVATFLAGAKARAGIVYLEVWQQHLTALDDPLIREPALGGPDTTTRVRTLWQVKVLPITSNQGALACDGDYDEWNTLTNSASTGMLTAQTKTPDDSGPCDIPPEAGYLRLENQLYRVEVHQGGNLGTATFKWSRENGSVVTGIVSGGGKTLTVLDSGPDDTLGFGNGQWAEVSDDYTELTGQPGQLVQIDTAMPGSTQITLLTALSGTVDPSLHPKLRAWNQTGASASTSGVATGSGPLDLEGGIQVQFAPGTYRTGDYWVIPARTATGEIEWPPFTVPLTNPMPLPPLGNQHAYCRLALVSLTDNGTLKTDDCRTIFPPLTDPAGQTKPAIHVVTTNWSNDDRFDPVIWLQQGLRITFDQAPDPRSVKAATMIVTVEAPWSLVQAGAIHAATVQAMVARPVTGQPVAAEPAVTHPVTAVPLAGQPAVAEPVLAHPIAAQPVSTQSAQQPGAAQPVTAPAAGAPLGTTLPAGASPEISIILDGTIRAVQPTVIQWVPSAASAVLLEQVYRAEHGREFRVRVTLKGHVIWAIKPQQVEQPRQGTVVGGMFAAATQQVRSVFGGMAGGRAPVAPSTAMSMMAPAGPYTGASRVLAQPQPAGPVPSIAGRMVAATGTTEGQAELLYLDGQAFGYPTMRQDGSAPRIGLHFLSGDGARASDFESWFYIGAQRDTIPTKNQAVNQPAPPPSTVNPVLNPVLSHVPRQG